MLERRLRRLRLLELLQFHLCLMMFQRLRHLRERFQAKQYSCRLRSRRLRPLAKLLRLLMQRLIHLRNLDRKYLPPFLQLNLPNRLRNHQKPPLANRVRRLDHHRPKR